MLIKNVFLFFSVVFITPILIAGCESMSNELIIVSQSENRSNTPVTIYRLGRFSIDIPTNIKQVIVKYVVYYAEIDEVLWKDKNNHVLERTKEWNTRLEIIKKMTLPEDIDEIIIGERDFTQNGIWSKGIAYRGDPMFKQVTTWDILIDAGHIGVWVHIDGTDDNKDKLIEAINDIVGSYRPSVNKLSDKATVVSQPRFYLQYGALDLPFKYKERVYTRFEGHPLDQYLKIKVEMNVVDEIEETNLIQRLSIALVGNFAPGISIDEIRSEQREVAGLKGEEVISLSFGTIF